MKYAEECRESSAGRTVRIWKVKKLLIAEALKVDKKEDNFSEQIFCTRCGKLY